MAQRKKKLTKKKRHSGNREPEADSESGDFELATQVKDDDSVRKKHHHCEDTATVFTLECIGHVRNSQVMTASVLL